jgi:pantoate--beta-alanine ligase
MTQIISEINVIRETVKNWKQQGKTIGFVPTMGALHKGHESLMLKARSECDIVVVSIFVNPIQFAPNEDFDKYPRQLEADRQICENNGVDFVFAPTPQIMYSEGQENITKVVSPEIFQDKLCGKSRIGHFNGVATVVLKLFNIVQPDKAYFGQKDAQQLFIIKKMVRDLDVPVEIIGCPIIREESGLALSSRNTYLSEEQKIKALTLSKVLKKIESDYKAGNTNAKEILENAADILDNDACLEYLEALDTFSMGKTEILKCDTLIAIAAKIGTVRLIDNIIL